MIKAVLAHWRRYFGEILSTHYADCEEAVCTWKDPENDDGRVLTTVGMSSHIQEIPKGRACVSPHPRTELMLFAQVKDVGALQRILLDLVRYPFANRCFLHWWQILQVGTASVEGSRLDGLLLTFPPYEDENFSTIRVGSTRIDIVWIVPIAESERVYAHYHGIAALEARFEQEGIDLTDLNRRPIS